MDLTVIGHTHFPFVRERNGSWLANSGSVAVPIYRIRTNDGPIEDRCARDGSFSSDDVRPSFLSITLRGEALEMQIMRFDYDCQGMLDRYARREDLMHSMALRRKWISEAFYDVQAIQSGN